MKTKYLKFITLSFIVINFIACKAQTIYPFNTSSDKVPDYSYIKDTKNELPPYIGIYKANYQGNEIILYITKTDKKLLEFPRKKFYKDVLEVRYIVKDSTGKVLQDTQNNITKKNEIESIIFNKRTDGALVFYYSGTNCSVGWGKINLKKINATQLTWAYYRDSMLLMEGECAGMDLKVYLPEVEGLVFTKQ